MLHVWLHLRTATIIAAVLAVSGCGQGQQQSEAPPPPPAVTVVAVAKDDIKPTVTFTGRVQARDKVELRARVEGFLQKRLFTEGQDVKEGDLLFVIEQEPYRASVDEIKASIEKAQAALTLANVEVERASQLVARQTGTQQRLDEANARQADGRGELARQKAALEKAELQLSYTEIRAPIAGRIGRATVSVGNFVGPATGSLATIVRQDPIYVSFPVTQREMLEVRKEEKAGEDPTIYLQLADGSRYAQAGKINFVDVTVNPGTDTVQVRAEFPNPGPPAGRWAARHRGGGGGRCAFSSADPAARRSDRSGRPVRSGRRQCQQGRGPPCRGRSGAGSSTGGDQGPRGGRQGHHRRRPKSPPGQVVQATEVKSGV